MDQETKMKLEAIGKGLSAFGRMTSVGLLYAAVYKGKRVCFYLPSEGLTRNDEILEELLYLVTDTVVSQMKFLMAHGYSEETVGRIIDTIALSAKSVIHDEKDADASAEEGDDPTREQSSDPEEE